MIHPSESTLDALLSLQWIHWVFIQWGEVNEGVCWDTAVGSVWFSLWMHLDLNAPAAESSVVCYDRSEEAVNTAADRRASMSSARHQLTHTDMQGWWQQALIGEAATSPYHRRRPGHRPQLHCHLSCRLIFQKWKEAWTWISLRLFW